MAEWICTKCGYIYNEQFGDEAHEVPKGTPFEKINEKWVCPRCKAVKKLFKKQT